MICQAVGTSDNLRSRSHVLVESCIVLRLEFLEVLIVRELVDEPFLDGEGLAAHDGRDLTSRHCL